MGTNSHSFFSPSKVQTRWPVFSSTSTNSVFFPQTEQVFEASGNRAKFEKTEEKKQRNQLREMGHMDTHLLSVLLGMFWRYQAQDTKWSCWWPCHKMGWLLAKQIRAHFQLSLSTKNGAGVGQFDWWWIPLHGNHDPEILKPRTTRRNRTVLSDLKILYQWRERYKTHNTLFQTRILWTECSLDDWLSCVVEHVHPSFWIWRR